MISREKYPSVRTTKCHCSTLQLVSFFLLNFFSLLVVFFPLVLIAGAARLFYRASRQIVDTAALPEAFDWS